MSVTSPHQGWTGSLPKRPRRAPPDVAQALFNGRAVAAFAVLLGVQFRTDILELAKHLRSPVQFAPEPADCEVGFAGAAACAFARDAEFRDQVVVVARNPARFAVTPGVHEKGSGESAFSLRFRHLRSVVPVTQAGKQCLVVTLADICAVFQIQFRAQKRPRHECPAVIEHGWPLPPGSKVLDNCDGYQVLFVRTSDDVVDSRQVRKVPSSQGFMGWQGLIDT